MPWYWFGLGLLVLGGCVRKQLLFQTPYDRAMHKALRRGGEAIVMRGPTDSVRLDPVVLEPGQFIRLVLEGPFLTEEAHLTTWSVIRVDTLRIYEDSLVYLPWAGSVRIGGLSPDSARALLQEAAQKVYKNVTARLYPLYHIYLFGSTQAQGPVFIDKIEVPLTVILSYIGTAQREAKWERIKIIRGDLSNPQIFIIDARKMLNLPKGFMIRAGDIVYIPPRDKVLVFENLQYVWVVTSLLQVINIVLLFLRRI